MIISAKMSVFDEQTFYIDFINYYHDNEESYDISEVFSWYFDEHIFNNTEKYNQWFKHFFPTHEETNEDLLFNKLFEIVENNVEGAIRSGEDTEDE
jgi:hypothetical protein